MLWCSPVLLPVLGTAGVLGSSTADTVPPGGFSFTVFHPACACASPGINPLCAAWGRPEGGLGACTALGFAVPMGNWACSGVCSGPAPLPQLWAWSSFHAVLVMQCSSSWSLISFREAPCPFLAWMCFCQTQGHCFGRNTGDGSSAGQAHS